MACIHLDPLNGGLYLTYASLRSGSNHVGGLDPEDVLGLGCV
jgi:hypothetical protein